LPHAPQFSESVWKLAASTQPVPHCVRSAGQVATHAAAEQNGVPAGQAMPHMPQLAPSDMVFAQPLVQAVSPAWHMQEPLHTCPALQAFPQPLQLATSVAVLAQDVPHASSGAGQLQPPFTHVCVPPHTLPHAPQLMASVFGFTQKPPHGAKPTGHWPEPSVAAPPLPPPDIPPAPLPVPALPTGVGVCKLFDVEQLNAVKPPTRAQALTKSTRNQRERYACMICGISSTRGLPGQDLEFSRSVSALQLSKLNADGRRDRDEKDAFQTRGLGPA
jgi:hypothetical protein